MRDQLLMGSRRQLQAAQHFPLRFAGIGPFQLVGGLRRRGSGQLVSAKRLEFDRVGPRSSGNVHQGERGSEAAVMIHASLGDDIARMARANANPADVQVQGSGHGATVRISAARPAYQFLPACAQFTPYNSGHRSYSAMMSAVEKTPRRGYRASKILRMSSKSSG